MFVSQTRGEKFPDKSVSLEDEGCLFKNDPTALPLYLINEDDVP